MRIFVAGATGVLGRRVVRRLVAAGHEVVGAARGDENRRRLAALGATARDCDVCDPASATRAAEGCAVVVHLATAIPMKQRTSAADWATNDRLRRDGTRALLAAARAAGARHVQASVCWLYGDHGAAWIDEATPRAARPHEIIRSSVDMERLVEDSGVPATILRFGGYYGADSVQTRGLVELVRRGKMYVTGDGQTYQSLIHLDDAAAATVRAATAGEPGTFNIVDDEPVTWRALVDHLAAALGAKRPGSVPGFLVRMVAGRPVAEVLATSLRVRNARARARLGFQPAHPTYRDGYAQVLAALAGGDEPL